MMRATGREPDGRGEGQAAGKRAPPPAQASEVEPRRSAGLSLAESWLSTGKCKNAFVFRVRSWQKQASYRAGMEVCFVFRTQA